MDDGRHRARHGIPDEPRPAPPRDRGGAHPHPLPHLAPPPPPGFPPPGGGPAAPYGAGHPAPAPAGARPDAPGRAADRGRRAGAGRDGTAGATYTGTTRARRTGSGSADGPRDRTSRDGGADAATGARPGGTADRSPAGRGAQAGADGRDPVPARAGGRRRAPEGVAAADEPGATPARAGGRRHAPDHPGAAPGVDDPAPPRAGRRRAPDLLTAPGIDASAPPRPGRRRAPDSPAVAGVHTSTPPRAGRRRAPEAPGTGRSRTDDRDDEARRIDETLSRLTAAHAGVTLLDDDRPPPAVRRRARPRPGVLLVMALALVVFAVTAFQYVAKARLDEAVAGVAALDPGSGAIVDAAAQAGAENVLVVAGAEPDGGPRTDTVLVAHVPAGGGEVVGLSIPRDLEVSRPPCRRWDPAAGTYLDEVVPAEARASLLSAIDLGGPQCATRVVQQLTGLAVTRYVGLDVDGAGALVDVLGGVDVCVDRPVLDDVLGPVVPAAGVTRLDGLRARDLLSARSVQGDAGERDAHERQARLLVAVLERVLSAEVLLDPSRIGAVRDALDGALTVDGADLDRVLATGLALRSFAADGVTFTTVPVAPGTSGQGRVLPQEAEAAALFEALREGATLPEQPVLAAAGGPTPGEVSVEVLNASDRQGLAGTVGDTLSALGFTVTSVGNAPEPATRTEIRFSPDRAAAAQVLGESVPSAVAVPDPAASGLLQLVLGPGFDDVVRAPTPTAPTAPEAPVVRCT